MKKHFSISITLLLLLLSSAVQSEQPKAPEFQSTTKDGSIQLRDFRGKLVYVDFWASWCRPCKKSFPWMIEIKNKYKDQPFEIIAINLDKDRQLAEKFISSQAINFPVAFDPEATIAHSFAVEGMPSSYLIDPKGNLLIRYTGFWNNRKDEKALKIDELINKFNNQQSRKF